MLGAIYSPFNENEVNSLNSKASKCTKKPLKVLKNARGHIQPLSSKKWVKNAQKSGIKYSKKWKWGK